MNTHVLLWIMNKKCPVCQPENECFGYSVAQDSQYLQTLFPVCFSENPTFFHPHNTQPTIQARCWDESLSF